MSGDDRVADTWSMSPERFVNALYHILLGREPDADGFAANVADLRASGDPTRSFSSFLASAECRRRLSLIFGSEEWIDEVFRPDISADHLFNDILHELRHAELLRTTGTTGTLLSVGCSNTLYFNWIHETLGKPAVHIGLEFYSPKPHDLPDNVRWIANTAGNMSDVANASVDLIFGGQVIEHLWADELVDFLHECTRVLKPGGRLVFDTPNERITRATGWKHAEHTMEFRPSDATALLTPLGFEIGKIAGHWLTETPYGILRLNKVSETGNYARAQRMEEGHAHPEASFSWWVEARLTAPAQAPRELTRTTVKEMWSRYGHFNFNRTTTSNSDLVVRREPGPDGYFAVAREGWSGALVQSTANALPPGTIRIGVELLPYHCTRSPGCLRISHPATGFLGERALPPSFGGGWLDVEAMVPHTLFGGDFSLLVNGESEISARLAFSVAASVHRGEIWQLSQHLAPTV